MRDAWIVIVLAACGGGGGPTDSTTPKEGPVLCERMADHLVGLMTTGDAAEAPQETVDTITRSLIQPCKETAWSLDAQHCFLGLAALEDADRCAPLLTIEQRDAADAAMKEAFKDSPAPAEAAPPAPEPAAAPSAAMPVQAAPPPPPSPAGSKQKKRDQAAPDEVRGDPCDGGE